MHTCNQADPNWLFGEGEDNPADVIEWTTWLNDAALQHDGDQTDDMGEEEEEEEEGGEDE